MAHFLQEGLPIPLQSAGRSSNAGKRWGTSMNSISSSRLSVVEEVKSDAIRVGKLMQWVTLTALVACQAVCYCMRHRNMYESRSRQSQKNEMRAAVLIRSL